MTSSSKPDQFVLAVDLGTSGCKCAVVSLQDGAVASWAFAPAPLYVDGVSAEQDPEDWWSAFLAAASAALSDEGLRSRVAAICCSAQGEGTVCLDEAGATLGRAMIWLDMRGAEAIRRRLRGRWLNIDGMAPIKLWRWLSLTGGVPADSGKDSAGHIAYIRDHQPERYERTRTFLNVLDYMNFRLTGRLCATPDSILTTWVTDNRNLKRVRYRGDLLAALDFDRSKFPQIVPSTEVLGPVLPRVADRLGLGREIKVVAGGVDTSAVAVGAAVRDYAPHFYLGTSSWLGAHVPFKKTDVSAKIASVPCAVPNRYLAVALQSTAGANLSFLRDRILFHPDELLTDEARPDVYEVLSSIAARVPPGANGLVYMPWLFGERAPVEDPTLRAGLFNLALTHSREDIIRAMMEGVALNTRWMMEPFDRMVGRSSEPLAAVGGGAQSDVWCQIIADVAGRPVSQMENPIQSNAIGAAFIAGVGLGAHSFDDVRSLRRRRRLYEPNPALRGRYDDLFETFKTLGRTLAPIYRRLNAGSGGDADARS
jgi:xylulokinase